MLVELIPRGIEPPLKDDHFNRPARDSRCFRETLPGSVDVAQRE